MTLLHDCPACLFAVKSNLRQAAAESHTINWLRRTPYLLCDPDILRAVGKVWNWLEKNGNALGAVHAYSKPIAACSSGKAIYRGESAQPAWIFFKWLRHRSGK